MTRRARWADEDDNEAADSFWLEGHTQALACTSQADFPDAPDDALPDAPAEPLPGTQTDASPDAQADTHTDAQLDAPPYVPTDAQTRVRREDDIALELALAESQHDTDDPQEGPEAPRAPGTREGGRRGWQPTLRPVPSTASSDHLGGSAPTPPAVRAGVSVDPDSAGSTASAPLLPPAHPRENPRVLAGLIRARCQADPNGKEQWTRFCQALWRADPAPQWEHATLDPRRLAPSTVRGYLDLAELTRSQLIYRVKNALAAPGARDVWDRYTARHRTPGKGRAHPYSVPCPDMLAFLAALPTEGR